MHVCCCLQSNDIHKADFVDSSLPVRKSPPNKLSLPLSANENETGWASSWWYVDKLEVYLHSHPRYKMTYQVHAMITANYFYL